MRTQLIEALQEHAKGHIAKHKANVEVKKLLWDGLYNNNIEE